MERKRDAQDRAEHLDNEDLDDYPPQPKQTQTSASPSPSPPPPPPPTKSPLTKRRISRIGEGSVGARDADGDAAEEVAGAHGEAAPEEGEAGVVVGGGVEGRLGGGGAELGGEDDGWPGRRRVSGEAARGARAGGLTADDAVDTVRGRRVSLGRGRGREGRRTRRLRRR